jgi:hypothetical protein
MAMVCLRRARLRHTSFEQLLGRGNDFGELIDGRPEFLLQIADAGIPSAEQWRRGGGIQESGVRCPCVSHCYTESPVSLPIRR